MEGNSRKAQQTRVRPRNKWKVKSRVATLGFAKPSKEANVLKKDRESPSTQTNKSNSCLLENLKAGKNSRIE